MELLDIFANIYNKDYIISGNKLECIVTLKDGTVLTAKEDLVYKTNVFGYEIIDPIVETKCLEKAVRSVSN